MLPLRSISMWLPTLRSIAVRNSAKVLPKQYKFSENNVAVAATTTTFQYDSVRHYAKGKQKEKARNKGVKFATYKLPEDQLNEIINVDAYRNKLEKALEVLQADYIKHLSLRSTTGSIETVKVKVDGEEHELQDIAQVIRNNPKTIVIDMIAFPQFIQAALQALQKSGLNINPQQENTTIYIPVPKVTKEHRVTLAKNAKALFIKGRDQIKAAQNEVIRKVKNNTTISEDDNHAVQGQLTEIANEYVSKAEKIFETKQNELLNN
ncbi:ribosome-recycling factor, mitochondrial [Sitodiplosis mosellana]|uniref:ribosome-recycling factor, mitochondrial n=1 Tax=Sitodiplosis mosellana TaxID=263140 RepID=UPI002444D4FF|nr:ribosome-recycling factor, mitochondrial [Sitodiplosis mosellana]